MLQKFQIPPGLKRETTRYSQQPKWWDCDKVRFYRGRAEKIGGWQRKRKEKFDGTSRGTILPWQTLDSNIYTAFGTHRRLYVDGGGDYNDITPVDETGSLNDPFSTTSGSTTVNVNDTTHNRNPNDIVIFSNATAVAGITIDGEYDVQSVVDSDNYEITSTTTATTTATGGGTVDYTYLLPVGREYGIVASGYGIGDWSEDAYEDAAVSDLVLGARAWTITNYGEDLIANFRGGKIYYWDASSGLTSNRATEVSNAPRALEVIVSQINRHVLAFGSEETSGSGVIDPLLIRWSDQEDRDLWTPAETNTAGSLRLSADAQAIIGAVETRSEILVWTNNTLHAVRPLFNDFVFGLNDLGQNCGLIGQNCAVDYNGQIFWMSRDDFYTYDGSVRPLYADVRADVFEHLDRLRVSQYFAGVNKEFNEIWWFYVSLDSPDREIDRYVIYNHLEQHWSWGSLSRTAWATQGIFAEPLLASPGHQLFFHEIGDSNAEDEAFASYLESGEFELPEAGQQFVFVDRIVPDLEQTTNLDLTFEMRKYPRDPVLTKGPYQITPTTTKIDTRARGRQFNFRLDESSTKEAWRLGDMRLGLRPDGER